jgi:hypothetical protein
MPRLRPPHHRLGPWPVCPSRAIGRRLPGQGFYPPPHAEAKVSEYTFESSYESEAPRAQHSDLRTASDGRLHVRIPTSTRQYPRYASQEPAAAGAGQLRFTCRSAPIYVSFPLRFLCRVTPFWPGRRPGRHLLLDIMYIIGAQPAGQDELAECARAQQSNTDQQMSFRNRWSSSTSSRIASGSWSRCHRHSSRPAPSPSPSGAPARAALIA